MEYSKVIIVGSSGKGKTYSFRNLDPETTGFVNIEDKPLPFKNKFKHEIKSSDAVKVYDEIIALGKNPKIETIVIDSFSAYMDSILFYARATYKGFDIWNYYNSKIGEFNNLIKRLPKNVFITAHYEILNIEGAPEKRVKVKGKEYEGTVEKDYTIVLYADSKLNSQTKRPDYFFHTWLEGTSTKMPPGIIKDNPLMIPNDCQILNEQLDMFYNSAELVTK